MNGNIYYFEVNGHGAFPHELLANQSCFPESKEDAVSAFEHSGSYRTVKLKGMYSPNKNLWRSYGWTVRLISGLSSDKEDYNIYHTWPC